MLALLFFATTINYLDRIVLSVLSPVILGEMNISKQQYGDITSAFQLTYTFGFIFFGWFIDRFGTRVGYAVSALWWSVAAMNQPKKMKPNVYVSWKALVMSPYCCFEIFISPRITGLSTDRTIRSR